MLALANLGRLQKVFFFLHIIPISYPSRSQLIAQRQVEKKKEILALCHINDLLNAPSSAINLKKLSVNEDSSQKPSKIPG
jgi:hypothetical protein